MFPLGCLIFLLFLLFLPILIILGYFHIVSWGFQSLGFSPGFTFLLFIAILFGSAINIPLTKGKTVYIKQPFLFDLFWRTVPRTQGIAINLGGAIIPILISVYFLFRIPLVPVLVATGLIIVISYYLARPVPHVGIAIPALIPPIFSSLFALILAPGFAAPCAFVSGVLGTLIGADILNLAKIQKLSPGFISIGGAGVFDGIFLVGIISAFLANL